MNRFSRATGIVAGTGVAVGMVLVCWSVLARSIGSTGLRSVEELTGALTTFAVFVALGYTFRIGGHVRTDLLISRLHSRPRQVVEVITSVIALGFSLVLMASMTLLWLDLLESGVRTPSGALPRWVPATAMVAGCAWLVLEVILHVLRLLVGQEHFTAHEETVPDV